MDFVIENRRKRKKRKKQITHRKKRAHRAEIIIVNIFTYFHLDLILITLTAYLPGAKYFAFIERQNLTS